MSGFAKLHREFLIETDLLRNHAAMAVYAYVLTRAAYKPVKCSWGTLGIGECDSTQEQIAAATGLTRRQVQTCEKTLQNMCLLRARTGNRRRVLSVVEPSTSDGGGARDVPEAVEDGARNVREACSNGARNVQSIEVEKGRREEEDSEPSAQAKTPGTLIDNSPPPPPPSPPPWYETIADRLQCLCLTEQDRGALCRLANELQAKKLSGQKVGRQRVEDLLTAIERSGWQTHGGIKALREYLIGGLLREIDGTAKPVETYTAAECERLAQSKASEAFQAFWNSGKGEGMSISDVSAWKANKAAELLPSILREHGH